MIFDIILLTFLILTLVYLYSQKRPDKYPPGPYGLPIIGHFLQLGKTPFIKFQNEWKQKYGPIVGVYFGSYRTVAISDYKIIKKVLMDPVFQGRPDMMFARDRSRDVSARGIIFTQGEEHAEQRKTVAKHMKDFGLAKSSYENVIMSQVLEFLDSIENENGQPIHLKNRFHPYILNILWKTVAGGDADKEVLIKLYTNCTKVTEENTGYSAVSMFIPWIAKYFPNMSGYNILNKELVNLWSFLGKHIDEHKEQYEKEPGVFHDLIGAYIHEIKKTTDKHSSFFQEVGERSMMSVLLDMFFAGADTTSLTCHWGLLFLATNPSVQEKFYQEIDTVVGKSRLPSLDDECFMPYSQAIVQEILRKSSIAAMAIFHNTTQNVELEGFTIPKDTMVLLNLHGAHHDQEYWGDPEAFRPARFLSPDEQSLIKHEAFFPFGLGRRQCIGEGLARNELFLFLVSIVQRFKIEVDPDNSNPSLEPIPSFLLMPQDHKLVISKRV